ncbi:cGMP-dependent 3',5'-cyclic phosphodiesterase-like isoform X1 [Hydractinia symbiolongicarpus]|uniref:cGMP-dependent 3',5'-cyclic phosphodiesterase-like isoform X1 n=1 Tax=Hydractinia symbiolongicarpus TaxID=13093 RepID=UPI00254A362A|nr:cGMP-dependent 3',5'-cyclic phosphodiesterase-like isoform X1 [Hydractinia symbiolongicarpus]XP_057313272.1 cGMP-dependent 3',5'-cyclic phosphodiesterase-like isoform X1 [Hydractinia symbiolongicarpus]
MEKISLLDQNCAHSAQQKTSNEHTQKRKKYFNKRFDMASKQLTQNKKLLELCLSESLDDLSSKFQEVIKDIYKRNLVQTCVYFCDPCTGEFKNVSAGVDTASHNIPDVVGQWCSYNNNNKHCTLEITSHLFSTQFKSIFSAEKYADSSSGDTSDSSLFHCCKGRKSRNFKVVSWPVVDDSNSSVVGLIFLLLRSASSSLPPVLKEVNENILKGYQKIMAKISNEQKLLLLSDLGSLFTKDLAELSRRIINKLTTTLSAESGVVLLANKNSDELYAVAFGNKILEEDFRLELCSSGFLFLYTQPKVHSFVLGKDSQISSDLEKLKEFAEIDINIENMLVVPAFCEDGVECAALFCLFNKIGSKSGFTPLDEELMSMVVNNCRHIVCNALDWKTQVVIQRQNEGLLDIAKTLFSHLDDVSVLLHKIMEEARNLTKAERCSLFLVDHDAGELVAKVFDGIEPEENSEMRIPINQGIAGYVASTGETLNIKDAYSHHLFYREVDYKTGFKTKHILCFPIRSISERILGVAQLCNKINGNCFTKFDEERTTAFAIFVGLSLVQSLLYKKATVSQQRSKLANELMLYHMRVSDEDTEKYTSLPIPQKEDLDVDMDKFSFMPRISFAESDSIRVVLAMFADLDLIRRWKIKEITLVRFILTVRRGYRDVPYHNWTHAWTVAHFSYLLLKSTKAREYISDLEAFVLLVSCLCHDIDHRGTNNSFQISSHSVLASLYSSAGSVLEHHHFAQAMCIIQADYSNVFESLSQTDYSTALDLMQKMILATDLANHFKIDKQIENIISGGVNKENRRHRELLLSLFMTTSDLSDQTKPWESAIQVSDLLYAEFFSQGDQEKSLGYTPIEMMDREKASIPELQLEFLSKIAYPIYKKLSHLFPNTECILSNINENRSKWSAMSTKQSS